MRFVFLYELSTGCLREGESIIGLLGQLSSEFVIGRLIADFHVASVGGDDISVFAKLTTLWYHPSYRLGGADYQFAFLRSLELTLKSGKIM